MRAFLSRKPTRLQQLWQERAGRISVQVLCEYYVNVTRKLKPSLEPQSG